MSNNNKVFIEPNFYHLNKRSAFPRIFIDRNESLPKIFKSIGYFSRSICLPQYFCKRRFYNCRLISHKDDYFYNIFEKNLSYSLPKEVFGHPSFCSTNKYKYEFLNHLSSNSPYNKNL